MNDLTPAYLAKFVHPVPEGATIPAGTEYAWLESYGKRLSVHRAIFTEDITQLPGDRPRWTAEPIPAPEPTLAERARGVGDGLPGGRFEQLALIVAELAERIEADR